MRTSPPSSHSRSPSSSEDDLGSSSSMETSYPAFHLASNNKLAEVCWTNDKHRSYLNSIEATFVKQMYDREFCAVDLCGQAPRHTNISELDCFEPGSTDIKQEVSGNAKIEQTRHNLSDGHIYDHPQKHISKEMLTLKKRLPNQQSNFTEYKKHMPTEVHTLYCSKGISKRLDFKQQTVKLDCKITIKSANKCYDMQKGVQPRYAQGRVQYANRLATQAKQSKVADGGKTETPSKILKVSRGNFLADGKSLQVTPHYFQYEAGSESASFSDDCVSDFSSTSSTNNRVSDISNIRKKRARETVCSRDIEVCDEC